MNIHYIKAKFGLFVISILCVISVCVHAGNLMILEPKFALNFKVISEKKGNVFGVNISGLCGHSAFAVKNIEVKKDDLDPKVQIVFIYLAPSDAKLAGSFSKWIPIPDEISSVVFGSEKKVIWKRDSGVRDSGVSPK
jgi:hypothetical protein